MQRRMKFLVPAIAANDGGDERRHHRGDRKQRWGGGRRGGGHPDDGVVAQRRRRADGDPARRLPRGAPEHHGELRADDPHRVRRRPADRARDRQRPGSLLRAVVRGRSCALRGGVHLPAHRPRPHSSFSEASLDPWTDDGVTYGLPFIATSHGFYYNADLLAEQGLEVPTTWDELLAVAAALDEAGITPSPTHRVTHGRWPN